jgi:crossover junction endodeoxyribonuclease RuvC
MTSTTTSDAGVNAVALPAKDTPTAELLSSAGAPAPASVRLAAVGEGEAPTAAAPLVVGLDLSLTATGIAHARGDQIVTDTIRGRGTGVVRLRQLAREIREHCRTADLVVIEAPNYHMGKSAGFHERAGLHWMVLERLLLDGRTWTEARTSVIRTYATGKGAHPGLGKGPMIEATTRRYPQVQTGGDDNQCDALWLAALGIDHLTGIHVVPQSHRRVLGSVDWPAVARSA